MTTAFTGNGAYCYANGLHMTLLAAGADPTALPEPGFLECATGMPFGRGFYPADGPRFWPSAPGWNPEKGLDLAINVLGWSCQARYDGEFEEAFADLRDGLELGPALAGPVDFGYLSYSPASRQMAGADHYVLVLALERDHVLVHDPAGYPYAVLPLADFQQAWQAERIGYRQGPYTLRACFRHQRQVSRQEVIAQTLPLARALVCADPAGPTSFGGSQALRQLGAALRDGVSAGLEGHLLGFSLPTAARRTTDAARLVDVGGRPDLAAILDREAVLWGQALSLAARQQWSEVAQRVDRLAVLEDELSVAL